MLVAILGLGILFIASFKFMPILNIKQELLKLGRSKKEALVPMKSTLSQPLLESVDHFSDFRRYSAY